jgi:hypothetical protein
MENRTRQRRLWPLQSGGEVIEQGGLGAGIAGHGSLKSDLQEIGLLSVVPDFGNVSPSQGIIQIGGRDLYLHAGYAAAACNQPRSTRSRCVVIILSANLFGQKPWPGLPGGSGAKNKTLRKVLKMRRFGLGR